VITGFNTDIEHDGVVYHVQTEDKGLDSPLILSLVYSGGAILASKRSRYEDLIASGFDEEALAQRLKRQHRLICAAINAGRIEDLKRMGTRPEDKVESPEEPAAAQATVEAADDSTPVSASEGAPEIVDNASDYASLAETPALVVDEEQKEPETEPDLEVVRTGDDFAAFSEAHPAPPANLGVDEEPLTPAADASAYTVHDSRRNSPLGEVAPQQGLVITLLDEQEFWSGGSFQIRIKVGDFTGREEKPMAGAALSVKILGTAFRPQLYSVNTERDGVAVVSAQIPKFTTGRAAILIKAALPDGRSAETRRVIHAAK
jgi:hypothetical protein